MPLNRFQRISVENPLPVTKNVTAKSSREYVSARKNPANIPGLIKGIITRVNTSRFDAPRSTAASISEGLISCNFGSTIITTIGILKAMCEIRTDAKPSLTPTIVNKIRNDAPIMTSGLTIKILFNDSTAFRIVLFRIKTIASAPSTPIAVETSADRRAMTIVLIKITMRRVSSKTAA